MTTFDSLLLRYAQDGNHRKDAAEPAAAAVEAGALRAFCGEIGADAGLAAVSDADCRLVLRIVGAIFRDPTRSSRELAEETGLSRAEMVRLYRLIRTSRKIQDALTFESPLKRRISFLRRELLPQNRSTLTAMFRGEACLPNHVEFHPALVCNLRCRACPNIREAGGGEWHFVGYRSAGEALNLERLRMIQDMFLDLGVESFSFGGGGEPSLSELTVPGIAHLRGRCERAEISLYTNGIFPGAWGDAEYETLTGCLNKIRFSIDAANALEWSQYKGRSPELFETLWRNIGDVVAAKRRVGGQTRIGASCLVSNFTSNVENFLARARDTGLDFCDIKEIETCYGEKAEYKGLNRRASLEDLLTKIRRGDFAPMDVVIDDNLVRGREAEEEADPPPTRCWVSIRGRMLTVGPYGELYPCSDAANPGSQYRRSHKDTLGQLTDFAGPEALHEQFGVLWPKSLPQRAELSRNHCAYCVPSHNNFNLAVEKLYQDWEFGIGPEEQPFSAEQDHYQKSRGMKR